MRYVRRADPDYPEKLTPFSNMPTGFYLVGNLPAPGEKVVAIVGSRGCTPYGRSEAARFAGELAEAGVGIISGMASGVDCAAQEGAIEAGGRTYAVLGCGADVCYPASSRRVYDAICAGAGGILSEYPPGAPPLAWHFPVRNRIISALSDLVLVIEAREKSGSLITAGYALDQGRTVYALPGRSTDPMSRGCNQLIADGAGIAVEPDQILMELGVTKNKKKPKSRTEAVNLDGDEQTVYRILEENGSSTDEIAEKSGLPPSRVSSALIRLSLAGLAREEGPGRFAKLSR